MILNLPGCFGRYFYAILQLLLLTAAFAVGALGQTQAPVLLTQTGSTRAIALESVTNKREPFSVNSSVAFGDSRARIVVFAWNAQLAAGEGVGAFTADVQDGAGRFYPLAVESAVSLPGVSGITMLVLRLNDQLQSAGDVLLRIGLHGLISNRVRIGIGFVGGGPPDDAPTSTTRFKVLHWNVAYGRGTDNIIDHNRQATWMANMQVDLISLNEVPPTDTQRWVDLLRQKTGLTWYSHWVAIKPGDSVGQQILSRHPIVSTNALYLSFGRSVTQAKVSIGGRTVNFFSTHLSFESSSWRATQIAQLMSWMAGFSEPRIIAGDFNMWDGLAEYKTLAASYNDSWIQAKNAGDAVAYSDNPEGKTRGGRIDFIFHSKLSNLGLIEVRMPDQRDLNNHNVQVTVGNSNDWGVRPSDHNFFVSTFELR